MMISEKDINNIGAYIKYSSDHPINMFVVDRERVLGLQESVNGTNKVYQLTLFCNLLFKDVSDFYPNFSEWVSKKVVPGIINGDREIIIALEAGVIIGYAVIKNTQKEKKICTLYVEPKARNKSVGTALLNIAKARLKENHPLITVSEDRISYFESLFEKNDFIKLRDVDDLYIKGKKEFIYNRMPADDE